MINKIEEEAKRIANLIVSGHKDEAYRLMRDYTSKTYITRSEIDQFESLISQYEYHLRYSSGVY